MTEQEKDGLLRLLEQQVDSGDLFSLYRDGQDRLTLEVRHGTVIKLVTVVS